MQAIEVIAEKTRQPGGMAKGECAFDAAIAQAATAGIAEQAARIPDLFAAPETDPKSEALPAVCDQFDTFTAQAKALESDAETAEITTAEDLNAALARMGGTCKSCHQDFRQK